MTLTTLTVCNASQNEVKVKFSRNSSVTIKERNWLICSDGTFKVMNEMETKTTQEATIGPGSSHEFQLEKGFRHGLVSVTFETNNTVRHKQHKYNQGIIITHQKQLIYSKKTATHGLVTATIWTIMRYGRK